MQQKSRQTHVASRLLAKIQWLVSMVRVNWWSSCWDVTEMVDLVRSFNDDLAHLQPRTSREDEKAMTKLIVVSSASRFTTHRRLGPRSVFGGGPRRTRRCSVTRLPHRQTHGGSLHHISPRRIQPARHPCTAASPGLSNLIHSLPAHFFPPFLQPPPPRILITRG